MLETERMTADYTYGDGKIYDYANFGVFKQSWGMLRKSVSRYQGKTEHVFIYGFNIWKLTFPIRNDWNTGSELNSNLCLDIQLRHESQTISAKVHGSRVNATANPD
ncbi:hypothetical protein CPB86DRAFT_745505 [Serendipita vermifera]|nr:hypothetical protein CPB86DRAFT_745505 [Serendipita vermifera]